MNNYIEMKMRKTGETVRVYNIFNNNNNTTVACVFIPGNASKNNGNGWETMKISALVPLEFYENKEQVSKTQKNKAKSRLTLVTAVWECTDGTRYDHEQLDDAIAHENELMEAETKEN